MALGSQLELEEPIKPSEKEKSVTYLCLIPEPELMSKEAP